jgi:DNA ligase-associated metallophosphoesterase
MRIEWDSLDGPGATGAKPAGGQGPSTEAGAARLRLAGVDLVLLPEGVLWWPDEATLVVADLHLEKGSSFARRGALLPPYDTAATLAALTALVLRLAPRRVVSLGDAFHDGFALERIATSDRERLQALERDRDWIWIAGNHDPDAPDGLGGRAEAALSIGSLTFRHEPCADAADGEIAGHLHPLACIVQRSRAISRRCFAADDRRIVMPAFGAYTGGLNVRHAAFAGLFKGRRFTAHMLGEQRLYAVAGARCVAD